MARDEENDFGLTKYILQASKKIAQFTKDYVGLPFSNRVGQLPFSIDARKVSPTKFFSTTRKWQRGDPLIGFTTTDAGQKKMILNLPDGSTMLDLCYPGWEVAVLDEVALDHFHNKRYLFGDYYAHLLSGKPLQRDRKVVSSARSGKDEIETPNARRAEAEREFIRQAELFRKRQVSLREAIEGQQRRGVPFDAQPEKTASFVESTVIYPTPSATDAHEAAADRVATRPRSIRKVVVTSQTIRENGRQNSRLYIQKTYDTGEVETTHRSHHTKTPADRAECDVEELLASQLFNVFVGSPMLNSKFTDASSQDNAEDKQEEGNSEA